MIKKQLRQRPRKFLRKPGRHRPAAGFFPTIFLSFGMDGTFMDSGARIRRVRASLTPLGTSKLDRECIRLQAGAMGRGEASGIDSPENFLAEIRRSTPRARVDPETIG